MIKRILNLFQPIFRNRKTDDTLNGMKYFIWKRWTKCLILSEKFSNISVKKKQIQVPDMYTLKYAKRSSRAISYIQLFSYKKIDWKKMTIFL